MAQNKHKNSVEEQRAKQNELIELKKQREAFKEDPENFKPIVENEVTVEQTTRSKLENFWYYSKFTLLGILIVAVIMTVGFVQCATKPKYDMTIVLYTKTFVDSVMSENIATIAETYCEDHDGNGEVNVLVVNCSIPDSERHNADASTRLMGQFQNEAAIVYIVDKGAYDDLKKNFGDDFLDNSLGLPDLDGTAYQLNGTVFDAAFDKVSIGYSNTFDYYLLRRKIGENATANKGDVKKHSQNADRFIWDVVFRDRVLETN